MYESQGQVTDASDASKDRLVKVEQPARKERTYLVAIMLFLGLLYGLLPAYLNGLRMLSSPDTLGGFWSPDSGARFAMIRNWVDYGSLVHFHYPYTSLDPTGQIHPLAYFLFHRSHDFTAMYPTLFPFLSGLAYRALGFPGLTLVPTLCGLGCLLVTYATAKRLDLRYRLLLVLMMGLATPLVIYSAVFWDHSALMLVAALVGYWMLRSVQDGSSRSAVIAGIMIGLGMWLHEQFLALFVAAWLAALPLLRTHRNLLTGLPLGFLIIVFLWGLFNWHVYGAFAGPHLGANVFQNNSDHPFGLISILNPNDFVDRAMAQLVGTTLPGSPVAAPSELWPFYLSLACLLIIYAFWFWEGNTMIVYAFSLILSLIMGSLALFLVLRISAFASPAGLFQATPLLIPALTVPWFVRGRKALLASINIYYAWLSRACFLFILFLLINPMYPGTDWGSRYLLTALPLLALLATYALERQYENLKKEGRGVAMVCTAALAGMSIICQATGLFWIHRMVAYDQDLNTWIRLVPSPVLVTDSDFNARLYPKPKNQARFLVRTDEDETLFAKILRLPDVDDFTFVGSKNGGEAITDAISRSGRSFRIAEQHKFFDVDRNCEIGDEFQMTHFILKTKKTIRTDGRSGAENRLNGGRSSRMKTYQATPLRVAHP